MSDNTKRIRKCCPSCDSVLISRRTKKGGYVCSNCSTVFYSPEFKMFGGGACRGRQPLSLLPRAEVQA